MEGKRNPKDEEENEEKEQKENTKKKMKIKELSSVEQCAQEFQTTAKLS